MAATARILSHQSQATTPASAPTRNAAGQPTRRFIKELAKAGLYQKNGEAVKLAAADLDAFAASFAKMREAGVKVPTPIGHTTKPDANRGWVEDMYREGDSLMGVVEAVGEDAIALAARSDVSIYAERDFTDGKGTKYAQAITHVAYTTAPVIPGMAEFVALSADGPIQVPVFTLAQETTMDWTKIALAMGCNDLTDANAAEKIPAFIAAQKAEITKATALSRDAKPTPAHPQVVALSAKNRKGELRRLLESGKVTKAVADKLDATFIGKDNGAIALDMADGGQGDAVFDQVVAAFAENNPVELGEKIKRGVGLSRTVPDETTPAYDEKVNAEMVQMAYGAPRK